MFTFALKKEMDYTSIPTPYYLLEEDKLRGNLRVIANVARESGTEIILAFKAFSLWKTFPIFREYINGTTASSLWESLMAREKFGCRAHTYSPAYKSDEIAAIAGCSSHLTFNSLSQLKRLAPMALNANGALNIGLRVNPEYSEIKTDIYNPCARGSRFGVTCDQLPAVDNPLWDFVSGFLFHCHCESSAETFVRTLSCIEKRFARWFPRLKWINFGGGHLMTRDGYDINLLIRTLTDFRRRYPWLKVIMEPGSAFAWHTGPLVASVVDIVENHGISTAILDVSFTCHMPDCLEMPYLPNVMEARIIDGDNNGRHVYRLGGNSCLSGDYMSSWQFDHPLSIGERIIFDDMNHYTTVKTTMFNGVAHPRIIFLHSDGQLETLRRYDYDDFITRMD